MAFTFDTKYIIKFQVTFFFMFIYLNIIIYYINQYFVLLIVELTYLPLLRIHNNAN